MKSSRSGFTLIELIVVLAVVGLLLALLLPAVQQVRASARLMTCRSNLRNLGIATHSYLDVHQEFPGSHRNSRGCLFSLLPFVEQTAVFIRSEALEDAGQKREAIPRIAVYLCPEDPTDQDHNVASYLINKGLIEAVGPVRGFVFKPVRPAEVIDGLSQTAFISENISNNWRPAYSFPPPAIPPLFRSRRELEALFDQCLTYRGIPRVTGGGSSGVYSGPGGYNHLLPPNSPVCQFFPYGVESKPPVGGHPQGVNVLLADGSVRFVSEEIDRGVWLSMGTIDGNDFISE